MRKSLSSLIALATVATGFAASAGETESRAFDDRPEYFFRDRPSLTYGEPVGHIRDIKREQDLVFDGTLRYSREEGKLNDWVGTTYKDKQAWLHSRGARAALSRLGVADPASELKRVTTPRTEKAVAAAPSSSGPTSQWQANSFSYSNGRAPAATMPRMAGFQNGSPSALAASPSYQGLISSASVGSSGGGDSAPVQGGKAPADPKADGKNPPATGVAIPICVKSKAEYDENKTLQKAFEGSKNPFTAWADRENEATLQPNGQGQWDLVVQGALLKTLPIQVCVEKEGAEPYLAVYNKRFDIKDNGTVQTVHLDDIEGRNGTFTQQSLPAKQKSGTKANTIR